MTVLVLYRTSLTNPTSSNLRAKTNCHTVDRRGPSRGPLTLSVWHFARLVFKKLPNVIRHFGHPAKLNKCQTLSCFLWHHFHPFFVKNNFCSPFVRGCKIAWSVCVSLCVCVSMCVCVSECKCLSVFACVWVCECKYVHEGKCGQWSEICLLPSKNTWWQHKKIFNMFKCFCFW